MRTGQTSRARQAGNALLVTAVMSLLGLLTVAGALAWSMSSAKQTYRSNQYACAGAAAEGATEKVAAAMMWDYLHGNEQTVVNNLGAYRSSVPTSSDSSYWSGWAFNDTQGNAGRNYVEMTGLSNYLILSGTYAGMNGYVSTFQVVSDATQTSAAQPVTAGVLQEIQLVRIPIFQFAMFSSGDLEISCGEPFVITGPVHSNGSMYVEPDDLMTFMSGVTAVGSILFARSPYDNRGAPAGSVVYEVPPVAEVPSLTLPLGFTNATASTLRELILPPPAGEDPTSQTGQARLYNQADMIIIVSNNGFSATSGSFNSFGTTVPSNQLAEFVTTTNSFLDDRESKTVLPIDINVSNLVTWSATNSTIRAALGGQDVSSVYVCDDRTLNGNSVGAVRLNHGQKLPSRGLSVATADPLYVLGNYNQTNAANLGTSNTQTTLPASLAADAVTALSPAWVDAMSTASLSSRVASPQTVNAAIVAGSVATTNGNYGGGMENFIRFLEYWDTTVFTYNGSLINLFPSHYATNAWGLSGVYQPPTRNWAFDVNFNNPAKLPPLTPSLRKVCRSQWAAMAPNQTNAPVIH
jgi:hypothetical protein